MSFASQQTGEKVHLVGEGQYAAESWPRARRVVFKAEALEKGSNLRFVVTSRTDQEPLVLYNEYVQRGEAELPRRISSMTGGVSQAHRTASRILSRVGWDSALECRGMREPERAGQEKSHDPHPHLAAYFERLMNAPLPSTSGAWLCVGDLDRAAGGVVQRVLSVLGIGQRFKG